MGLNWPALVLAGLLGVATLRHVYRGGTTLNDHAVAAVVLGCMGIWPALWWGAVAGGVSGGPLVALGVGLSVGAFGIYGLFFVLDRRVEAGALLPLAILAQPAYAFSLWTGLLFVFWIPLVWGLNAAGITALHPLWPGWWLLGPALLAGWGTAWTYLQHDRVRRYTLPGPRVGDRPLRLVHLSDLHASPCMTGAHLRRTFARANALKPDLILITGDLVMPFSEENHDYLLDALKLLEAPTLCCPGNHDLPVTDQLAAELSALGIDWLVDAGRVVVIGDVQVEVLGIDFRWKDAAGHLAEVLAANPAPTADYRLLLAHDPRYFDHVPASRFQLVLSGHTHGGQVGTDMFGLPGSVLGWLGFYDQGFFTRGGQRLYVHRGNWHTGLPPRMGIGGEIACFDLRDG